jgi:hypothetical protein
MTKRTIIALAVAVFAGALTLSAADDGATQTLKGYVTDTYCGLNRVNRPPTAECTVKCVKEDHAKYAGQTVVVKGTVGGHEDFTTMKGPDSGAIITASSITPADGR